MTNRKRQRRLKSESKALQSQPSSRAAGELLNLKENKNMNRNYRDNDRRDGDFNSQSIVTIVNEEFAKNATPDVTKAAILARLNDDCSNDTQNVSSFKTEALKQAAIKADAASPVSAQHTAALAAATVTG